jgi:hypothetical protein
MGEVKLALLVDSDPESVSYCCTNQAWLDSNPKAFPSAVLVNLAPALVKSTVEHPIYRLIGARLRDLNRRLYYILRIGEDPAADTRDNSYNQPFRKS